MSNRLALVVAGGLLAIVLTASPDSGAEELRTVVPRPLESPRRVDPLLTMTGAVLFGIPYSASFAIAATSGLAADRWLYAPVIGPVGSLVARSTCDTPGCRGTDLGTAALPLVLDGMVQAAGVGVIVVSVARPSKPVPAVGGVHLMPTTYRGGAGLSAFGVF
jgi:hypothetical protein